MLAPVSGTAPRKSNTSTRCDDRADRVHEPPERVERDAAPRQHDRARGSSAGSARARRVGLIAVESDSVRTPRAPKHQLERLGVQRVELERRGGVEHEHAGERGSPAGTSRLSADSHAGGVAPAELVLGRAAAGRLVGVGGDRLRAAPPRSSARPSEARGSPRAGAFALSSSNAANAAARREPEDGPSPRCRASAIALETLWVSARVARSDSISVERVLAVAAGRAAGAREAVAALPAAQRVGADAEHDGRGVGANSVH